MSKQLTVGELKKFIERFNDMDVISLLDREGCMDVIQDVAAIIGSPNKVNEVFVSVLPFTDPFESEKEQYVSWKLK